MTETVVLRSYGFKAASGSGTLGVQALSVVSWVTRI